VRTAAAGANLGAVHYGGASRQQGDVLLNLFYPDHDNFWLGLLPGIPAVLAFIVSGQRQRFPRLWPLMRWLLVLSQTLLLLWQPLLWLSGESPSMLTIGLLIADLYAFWWLLASRRLKAVFRKIGFNGTFCRSCTPTGVK
jgi:drug/metabolite transporter (DMT)-like permease